jgi:hypothetical protein
MVLMGALAGLSIGSIISLGKQRSLGRIQAVCMIAGGIGAGIGSGVRLYRSQTELQDQMEAIFGRVVTFGDVFRFCMLGRQHAQTSSLTR